MILKFLGLNYDFSSFKLLENFKKNSTIKINFEYTEQIKSQASLLELPDGDIIPLNTDIISDNIKEALFSKKDKNCNLSENLDFVLESNNIQF